MDYVLPTEEAKLLQQQTSNYILNLKNHRVFHISSVLDNSMSISLDKIRPVGNALLSNHAIAEISSGHMEGIQDYKIRRHMKTLYDNCLSYLNFSRSQATKIRKEMELIYNWNYIYDRKHAHRQNQQGNVHNATNESENNLSFGGQLLLAPAIDPSGSHTSETNTNMYSNVYNNLHASPMTTEQQERCLTRDFFIQCFQYGERDLVRRYLMEYSEENILNLQYIHNLIKYGPTLGPLIKYVARGVLGLYILLMFIAIFLFNRDIGSRSNTYWTLIGLISFLQYNVLLLPIHIFMKKVILIHSIANICHEIAENIGERGKMIMLRTQGMIRNSNCYLQHFNAATRVARLYPTLPISRFLFSLNDLDVPLIINPLEVPARSTKESIVLGLRYALYPLTWTLSYLHIHGLCYLSPSVYDILINCCITLAIDILAVGLIFYSYSNPIYAIAIAALLGSLILIREVSLWVSHRYQAYKAYKVTQQSTFYALDRENIKKQLEEQTKKSFDAIPEEPFSPSHDIYSSNHIYHYNEVFSSQDMTGGIETVQSMKIPSKPDEKDSKVKGNRKLSNAMATSMVAAKFKQKLHKPYQPGDELNPDIKNYQPHLASTATISQVSGPPLHTSISRPAPMNTGNTDTIPSKLSFSQVVASATRVKRITGNTLRRQRNRRTRSREIMGETSRSASPDRVVGLTYVAEDGTAPTESAYNSSYRYQDAEGGTINNQGGFDPSPQQKGVAGGIVNPNNSSPLRKYASSRQKRAARQQSSRQNILSSFQDVSGSPTKSIASQNDDYGRSDDEMAEILGRSVNASTQLLNLSTDDALPTLDFLSVADREDSTAGMDRSRNGIAFGSESTISNWNSKGQAAAAQAAAVTGTVGLSHVSTEPSIAPVVGGGVVGMNDGSWANNPTIRNRMLAQAKRNRAGPGPMNSSAHDSSDEK